MPVVEAEKKDCHVRPDATSVSVPPFGVNVYSFAMH
jgi:hypothetical protein